MGEVEEKCIKAKKAASILAALPTEIKDRALLAAKDALVKNANEILEANKADLDASFSLPKSVTKRLELNDKKIAAMAEGFGVIASFPDPVGSVAEKWKLASGLKISRVRVPLGVLAFIYEARPNVTTESTSLALKSGNAIILRGGKEAISTNRALVKVMQKAFSENGIPADAVQLIEDTSHEAAAQLMKMRGYVDVLIPRGGAGLIKAVVENARVPVIETGAGNCHAYVDEGADLSMAEKIILNAKLSSPYVCNALEHVLVNSRIAEKFVPRLCESLAKAGVEIRGDEVVAKMVPSSKLMTEKELYDEYLDLVVGIKIVKDVNEAIVHINKYGTHHSDAIITKSKTNAALFARMVDSCCVYVNASTRFSDGYTMGFGGEVGISTQRLHARGPIGLKELCTTKLVCEGAGHVRE
ncbi:TPA: glutamate-5-semialdehyde dehydrogenase [Candidatus Micrarchaeota archaeon]|nr:glutamate-5-semialdehyde dehydrogenase [Candidatus Micrarchaeota archaeon]